MSETSSLHDADGLVVRYLANPRPDLKDMIMVQCSGLVERVARRFAGIEPVDDLIQVGYIGLLNALSKFDPNAGVKFNTYATHLVAGEIKHYLRDRTQTIRQPAWLQELRHKVNKAAGMLQARLARVPTTEEVAAELSISVSAIEEVYQTQEMLKLTSLDQTVGSDDDGSSDIDNLDATAYAPEQLSVEDRVVLERAIHQLRDLEREVLVLFHFDSLNQTEIAHRLGISCNYVSHILRQSLGKLRRILSNEEASDRILRQDSDSIDQNVVDPITGVYNEEYFRGRLREETHRADSQGSPMAVIAIDFIGINDLRSYYGEVCVRDFLADASDKLKTCVRRLDILCRFGETGFGIILPGTGISAEVVSKRIIDRFEEWLKERRAPGGQLRTVNRLVTFPEQANTPGEILELISEISVTATSEPAVTLLMTEGNGVRKSKQLKSA